MRVEQFKYFLEVAKTGSMRTAADNLYITQPALGAAITSLERELGYPLFERSHKGVVLTGYGEKTLEVAVDVLKQLERLNLLKYQYNHTQGSTLSGRLTITTIATISLELMQRVIPAFSSAHPEVELVIIERNSAPAREDVCQGRSDMGFLSLEHAEITEEYAAERLWTEKLYAVVNQASDLARKTSISLKQVSRYPLAIMAYDQEDNFVYEGLFAKAHLHPKIVMRSSNFELTQRHILQNFSVGLAYIASIKDPHRTFLEGISVVPIADYDSAPFYAFYKKNHPKRELIDAFIQALREIHW